MNPNACNLSCMTQNGLLSGLREALRAELKSGVQALRFMAEIERREDAPAAAAYVPAATRRAVVERDGAQCTYVSRDGRRCSERSNLEFDHVGGRALGAKSVVGELRLLCRAHNLHAASEVLGHALIDRRIHERRSTQPRQDMCTERPRREGHPTPPARAEGGT
ncbi:MAG: hypothetical protein RIT81_47475 [Deltaproteobacteria bacterium]